VTHEVGSSKQVTAFHVMPGMSGPEGSLHSHDYRVDVVVGRGRLDARAMVCDLDVLEAALGEVLSRVEGKDLEAIRPDDAEAVTVEIFAHWVHRALAEPVRMAGGETLSVRVWESAVAFGGYRADISV
jgi:6-pyruvoyltetrahydropterin/6-carboxytetrahydropterin synthase